MDKLSKERQYLDSREIKIAVNESIDEFKKEFHVYSGFMKKVLKDYDLKCSVDSCEGLEPQIQQDRDIEQVKETQEIRTNRQNEVYMKSEQKSRQQWQYNSQLSSGGSTS